MRSLPWASVDFILTDPPYLVNYRDRSGRSVANDGNDGAWLKPAFRQMYRGGEYIISPLFVALTPGMILTDHDHRPWAPLQQGRVP